MKIWLSKNSEVPLRDQLVAQIRVGVASGDLKAGDRLPSTRALARQFAIHPNTVSTAYRELAEAGEVERRQGSGVYVSSRPQPNGDALDALIDGLIRDAERIGIDQTEAMDRLRERIEARAKFEGFALIEPNVNLRAIVVEEVSAATGLPVFPVAAEEIEGVSSKRLRAIAMFDEAPKIAPFLKNGAICIFLKANSVSASMAGRARPGDGELIAIASAWADFLTLARLYLLAARLDPDSIVTCSPLDEAWTKTINCAAKIICDSATANLLPGDERILVFPLIAESSLTELRSLARPVRTL